jgi:hypothetical protein
MAEPNPIFVIHFGTQMSNAQTTTNEATRRPFSQTKNTAPFPNNKCRKKKTLFPDNKSNKTTLFPDNKSRNKKAPFPDNKCRNKKAPFPDNNEATWRSLSQIIVRDL